MALTYGVSIIDLENRVVSDRAWNDFPTGFYKNSKEAIHSGKFLYIANTHNVSGTTVADKTNLINYAPVLEAYDLNEIDIGDDAEHKGILIKGFIPHVDNMTAVSYYHTFIIYIADNDTVKGIITA